MTAARKIKTEDHPGLADWLKTANGASAGSIVAHLTGQLPQEGHYPHDSSDFARCEALLNAVPTLRPRLAEMADVNAYWAALVPAWDDLRANGASTLRAILAPIQAADPHHFSFSNGMSMRSGSSNTYKPDEADPLFSKAVMMVWKENNASTSFLQRSLGVGYNEASRLIERMQELSIVTAPDKMGIRKVRSPEDLRHAIQFRDLLTDAVGQDLATTVLKAILAEAMILPTPKASKRPAQTGHNSAPDSYSVTADELRQFIERFEQLESEKKDVATQQKELLAEAKGRGYDTKILRMIIALRRRKADDLAEEQAILELYKTALGMN